MGEEKYKRKRPFRLQVRFNKNEYERLEKESKDVGKGKGFLLKESYFKGSPRALLMSAPQVDKVVSELNRIGNNINQLAYKANIGDIVLDKNFAAVQEELHQLFMFIRRVSGLR